MKSIHILWFAAAVIFMMALTPIITESTEHEHNTITGIAADTEELSTLVAALEAAGLDETLKGDGPFTVFAPTNDAFSAIYGGTLENLLKEENRHKLVDILTFHVISGEVTSADLENGMEAETVQGSMVTIMLGGDVATVNGARISATDIEASNGVIHIIDAVIIPES